VDIFQELKNRGM